jgi:CBS domain-containing protein
MRVKSLMTTQVTSCAPEASLAVAARTMRSIDAGILPVISGEGPSALSPIAKLLSRSAKPTGALRR